MEGTRRWMRIEEAESIFGESELNFLEKFQACRVEVWMDRSARREHLGHNVPVL